MRLYSQPGSSHIPQYSRPINEVWAHLLFDWMLGSGQLSLFNKRRMKFPIVFKVT